MAACDIALWDLKREIFQEPIWRLIGGFYRDQIPVYVSGLSAKDVGCPAGSLLLKLHKRILYRDSPLSKVSP
ncbi:hypothetical protein CMK17_10670 [Candidatus Poribacteria bacterium]|nr:hypothetical protein [Candidatus Poribacteria bacterium]